MSQRAVIVAVVLMLALPARAQDSDAWVGIDKAQHFGVAALLASGGFVVASLLLDSLAGRLGTGAGLAIGAGIGKELWDDRTGGDPSFRDLTWDALGTVVGLAVGWCVVAALDASSADDRSAASQPAIAPATGDSISDQMFP